MQGLSLLRFLSALFQSLFQPHNRCQKVPVEPQAKWIQPLNTPAGGWLFPARRMDSFWQRMFLLLSRIKIKVYSAESGFLKRLSQTPPSTWPWLSICIIGVAGGSARHSLPCFWSVCTSSCVAVGTSIQGPQKLSNTRMRCLEVVILLVLFMWSNSTGLALH